MIDPHSRSWKTLADCVNMKIETLRDALEKRPGEAWLDDKRRGEIEALRWVLSLPDRHSSE